MSSALAVSIGNTRTQIGRIVDGTVQEYATVSSDTPTEALEQLVAWSKDIEPLTFGPATAWPSMICSMSRPAKAEA